MKIENALSDKVIIKYGNKKDNECVFDTKFEIDAQDNHDESQCTEVGMIHYCISDVEVRIYEAKDANNNLYYRVNTFTGDKLEKQQDIYPSEIDPRNATIEEVFALDEYLHYMKILPGDTSIIDTSIMGDYKNGRYDYFELGSRYMNMQLEAGNYEMFLFYKKIMDTLTEFVETKPT